MTSGSGVDASTVSQEALSTIPRRWRFMLMSSSSGMLSRICVGEGEEIYQLCDFDGTRVLGVLHDLMDVALYGDNLHFKVEAIFVQFLALSVESVHLDSREKLSQQTTMRGGLETDKNGKEANPIPRKIVTGINPYVLINAIDMSMRLETVLERSETIMHIRGPRKNEVHDNNCNHNSHNHNLTQVALDGLAKSLSIDNELEWT